MGADNFYRAMPDCINLLYTAFGVWRAMLPLAPAQAASPPADQKPQFLFLFSFEFTESTSIFARSSLGLPF